MAFGMWCLLLWSKYWERLIQKGYRGAGWSCIAFQPARTKKCHKEIQANRLQWGMLGICTFMFSLEFCFQCQDHINFKVHVIYIGLACAPCIGKNSYLQMGNPYSQKGVHGKSFLNQHSQSWTFPLLTLPFLHFIQWLLSVHIPFLSAEIWLDICVGYRCQGVCSRGAAGVSSVTRAQGLPCAGHPTSSNPPTARHSWAHQPR